MRFRVVDDPPDGQVEQGNAADQNGDPGRIDGKDNAHVGQNEAQKQADAACNGHWNSCQEVRQFFHTISSQTLDAPKQIRYSIFVTECFV